MAEVTLTASMRANLYSLQQTAQLMGTIQQRLATGKKVNSALDNPNSFFQAQSLTHRANDINSLLDGMGQAIQTIKQASQGIESAQKVVDQMKSVANSASQSITSASNADDTNVNSYTPLGTKAASATAMANIANANYSVSLLTELGGTTGSAIAVGDTLTVNYNGNNYTFTVGAATDTTANQDGGGNTLAALDTWLENLTDITTTPDDVNGDLAIAVANNGNAATFGGNLATKLGISATIAANATDDTNALTYRPNPTGDIGAVTTATDHSYNLTSLIGSDASNHNILRGDTMTVQVGTGATYTFTVGASAVNNSVKGDGGGDTLNDVATWLATVTSGTVGYSATTGQMTLTAIAAGVTISGNLANGLGMNATSATDALVGTKGMFGTNYTLMAAATGSTKLADLTNSNGLVLSQVGGTSGGTGQGNYLTLQVGGGTVKSINITEDMTVQEMMDSINSVAGLSATLDAQGNFKIVNNNSTGLTIGGTASGLVGATSVGANSSQTNTIYEGYGKVNATNLPSTSLVNLQPPTGESRIAVGDQLKITVDGVTTTISVGAAGSSETATSVTSVNGLLSALGQISGITATLDAVTGELDVKNSSGKSVTFDGNVADKLGLPPSVANGQSSLTGGGVSATFIKQFDGLRTQLDQLVADASYKGVNLISGENNNPLTVTFNEAATNANKLVINAVDLTTTGLGITKAESNWKDSASIQETLTQLTNAASTLREQASTLGQNLTSVQTRQEFATNMIATLKEGADKLTLADMNEEGANMLALQTRSQLGTQSLSLASQANQAVMRLFG